MRSLFPTYSASPDSTTANSDFTSSHSLATGYSLQSAVTASTKPTEFSASGNLEKEYHNCLVENFVKDLSSSSSLESPIAEEVVAKICDLTRNLKHDIAQQFLTRVMLMLQETSNQSLNDLVAKIVQECLASALTQHQGVNGDNREGLGGQQYLYLQGGNGTKTNAEATHAQIQEFGAKLKTIEVFCNDLKNSMLMDFCNVPRNTAGNDFADKGDNGNRAVEFSDLQRLAHQFERQLYAIQENRIRAEDIIMVDDRITELTAAVAQNMDLARDNESKIKQLSNKMKSPTSSPEANTSKTAILQAIKHEMSKKFEDVTAQVAELRVQVNDNTEAASTKMTQQMIEERGRCKNMFDLFGKRATELDGSLLSLRENVDKLWTHHESDMSSVALVRDRLDKIEEEMHEFGETIYNHVVETRKMPEQAAFDNCVGTCYSWVESVWEKMEELDKSIKQILSSGQLKNQSNEQKSTQHESIVELDRSNSVATTADVCLSAATTNCSYNTAMCFEEPPLPKHVSPGNNDLASRLRQFSFDSNKPIHFNAAETYQMMGGFEDEGNRTLRVCNLSTSESLFTKNNNSQSLESPEASSNDSFSIYKDPANDVPAHVALNPNAVQLPPRVALAASDQHFDDDSSSYYGSIRSNSSIICNFETPSGVSNLNSGELFHTNSEAVKKGSNDRSKFIEHAAHHRPSFVETSKNEKPGFRNGFANPKEYQEAMRDGVLGNWNKGLNNIERLKTQYQPRLMSASIQGALDMEYKLQCLEKTMQRQEQNASLFPSGYSSGINATMGYTAGTSYKGSGKSMRINSKMTGIPSRLTTGYYNEEALVNKGNSGSQAMLQNPNYHTAVTASSNAKSQERSAKSSQFSKSQLQSANQHAEIGVNASGQQRNLIGFKTSEFFKDSHPIAVAQTKQKTRLSRHSKPREEEYGNETTRGLGKFNTNKPEATVTHKSRRLRNHKSWNSRSKARKSQEEEDEENDSAEIKRQERSGDASVGESGSGDTKVRRHRIRPFFKKHNAMIY